MLGESTLVTGAAGFIGYHVAHRLLEAGQTVIGLDNVNAYYDPALKRARLAQLAGFERFHFAELDLADRARVAALFTEHRFSIVVHLAAQAGVRYSLEHPFAYVDANLQGFINVLEGCRHTGCRHLLYASSSSVYGANTRLPFSVHDNVDHPISLYAATKKANELMAHSYSHLFRLPATGLRFFTVYGPWGRPDMAMFIFAKAITEGGTIRLFNYGNMLRDFTYIDDAAEMVVRLIPHLPAPDPAWSGDQPEPATSTAPYRLYNIGNNKPVAIGRVVELLEAEFGRSSVKELVPMQPGDMPTTCADINDLQEAIGFAPATPIEQGISRFAAWYRERYLG
ncbi:MAG: SDR family NAD(P)-dependent oxidoreductase [Rhizobiales bacterium]|nr:SDR family NAD(P)-dependent oxidoreductase [Hyphomicrobiales bacterium]